MFPGQVVFLFCEIPFLWKTVRVIVPLAGRVQESVFLSTSPLSLSGTCLKLALLHSIIFLSRVLTFFSLSFSWSLPHQEKSLFTFSGGPAPTSGGISPPPLFYSLLWFFVQREGSAPVE